MNDSLTCRVVEVKPRAAGSDMCMLETNHMRPTPEPFDD
jgi:hypothetical protein